MVVTHEGYAIPLHVRNGLYYMDMFPVTDDDLDQFPHIFLTADAPGTLISSMKNSFMMRPSPLLTSLSSKHAVMVVTLLLIHLAI